VYGTEKGNHVMKRKFLYIFSILLTLSACGGAATPAVDMTAVQETALANAWLAMTQTQAAMPTATATSTPVPAPTAMPTFVVVPTMPLVQPTLAPVGSPTTNPCYNLPPAKPKGKQVQVKFVNKSDAVVTSLSFGMLEPNAQGECATYSLSMGRYDAPVLTVLAGCYWAYGYTDIPSTPANPYICLNDATKTVSLWVTKDTINFH
jgi:hypothetical protein